MTTVLRRVAMMRFHKCPIGIVPQVSQRSESVDLVSHVSRLSSRHRTLQSRSCGTSALLRDATSAWQSSIPRAACRHPGSTFSRIEAMGPAAGLGWTASMAFQQALPGGAGLKSSQSCGNVTSCRGVAHSVSLQVRAQPSQEATPSFGPADLSQNPTVRCTASVDDSCCMLLFIACHASDNQRSQSPGPAGCSRWCRVCPRTACFREQTS